MILVDGIWLPDPVSVLAAGAFGDGALIRLERSDDAGDTYAEIDTIAILATTVQYSEWDAAGYETSLYRWRVSDATDASHSPYSAPFAGTNPAGTVLPVSYATLAQGIAVFESQPAGAVRLARLGSLLGTATAQVIDECGGRDYFRHPAFGSATWLADGDGTDTLHIHEGLVALDTLELSFDGGLHYVPVAAADYMLLGDSPYSQEPVPAGEPYFHVRFTGYGQYTTFQPTVRAARLTGARGWAVIPSALPEATAQRARQLRDAEASYSGSAAGGLDQMGRPATTDRFWPQSLYNFLIRERERFMGCHVGVVGATSGIRR